MAITVADLLVKIGVSGADNASAAIKGLGGNVDSLAGKAISAGKKLTLGMTTPIVGFGTAAVMAASDLNESASAVNTVFGDSAQVINRFSNGSAQALGQSRAQVLGAAATFGALYKAVGLTESQMADFSTQSIQAASDLGSFYNVDPTQVLQDIRSGLVGEAEPLRKYGILLSEAAVQQKAMEMTGKSNAKQLTESDKVMARQALIMGGLGAAQGDFARTSGSLANQMRIARASVTDMAASIGMVLMPYVIQATQFVAKMAQRLGQMSPHARKLVVIFGLLAAALGPVLIVLGTLASSLAALGPAFAVLTGPIGLVILALVGLGIAYKKNLFGFRDAVNRVAKAVLPFIKGVLALGKAMKAAFSEGKPVSELVKGLPGPFQSVGRVVLLVADAFGDLVARWRSGGFMAMLEYLPGRIGDLVEALTGSKRAADIVTGWIGDVISGFRSLIGAVMEVVAGIQAVFAGDWSDAWSHFKDAATLAFDGVKTLFLALPKVILEIVKSINWGDLASGLLNGIISAVSSIPWGQVGTALLNGMISAAQALLSLTGSLFSFVWDAITGVDWSGLADTIGGYATDLIDGFFGALDPAWEQVKTWIGDIANKITSALPSLSGTLFDKGMMLIDGLKAGIEFMWDDYIKPFFSSIGDKVLGLVPGVIQTLFQHGWDLLQGLYNGVKNAFDGIVSPFFKTMLDTIKGLIPNPVDVLTDVGRAVIGAVWDGMKAVWGDIEKWFGTTLDTITGWASDVKNAITGLFSGGGDDNKDKPQATGNAVPGATQQPQTSPAPAAPDFSTLIAAFGQAGTDAGNAYQANLAAGLIRAWQSVNVHINLVVNRIVDLANNFGVIGDSAGAQYQQNLTKGLILAYRSMTVHTNLMISKGDELKTGLATAGDSAGLNYGSKLIDRIRVAYKSFSNYMSSIQSAADALAATLGNTGTTAGSNFRNGLSSGLSSAEGRARTASANIRNALSFGSLYSEGYNIGSSLGQGINSGIGAWVNTIANTAANAVNSAISAARAAAGNPHSPSPVSERLVGSPLGEGVYAGIIKWVDPVNRAMGQLVAMPSVSGLPGGSLGLPGAAVGRPAGVGTPTNITFAVLTREELNHLFAASDIVRVLTSRDEISAVYGGV